MRVSAFACVRMSVCVLYITQTHSINYVKKENEMLRRTDFSVYVIKVLLRLYWEITACRPIDRLYTEYK